VKMDGPTKGRYLSGVHPAGVCMPASPERKATPVPPKAHNFPAERTLVRLDGHYGSGTVVADVSNLSHVTCGKDYSLLDHAAIQAHLHLPADQYLQSAESGIGRALYDCPDQRLDENGPLVRVIVATHPAPTKKKTKRQVGLTHSGVVYEPFFTNLSQSAFTASDVVPLYLDRGAFETALEDEDIEQEPDRWCSYSAWGQEAWQIVAQWTWNIRLELGHTLAPEPVRTTEFALALPPRRSPHLRLRPHLLPSHPLQGMLYPFLRRPGKLVVSPGPTFLSNLMGPCVAPLGSRSSHMKTVARPMGACV
jgi:hypothetical protein